MDNQTIINTADTHFLNTYKRFELCIEKGFGSILYDEKGNEYVDFSSGIGVNSLGHNNLDWINAITNQAKKVSHISNLYYNDTTATFAKNLTNITGYSKVFLSNSGTESNECAFKIARKYSFSKYGENRHTIITLMDSFHGRTYASLTATGQPSMHKEYFAPFMDGFIYKSNIDEIKNSDLKTVCAIMIEPIQGEGGVKPLTKEFVEEISKICVENDILLIADEVQTGVGRTGKFLAMENFGIKADITTLAKGLGGGLPIGATLVNEKLENVLVYGDHGSTFGANPIVCSGANVVIEKLADQTILNEISSNYKYFYDKIIKMKNVKNVRGMGLMIGIELESSILAIDVCKKCISSGLIVLTAHDVVRLLPPLTINKDEIDRGLNILEKVLEDM